jgi:isopenicillin-N N-acyltransferase-like protein
MMPDLPFPLIVIEGTPYDRGYQYGSRCQEMITQVVDFYRGIFQITSKLSWDQCLAKAAEFVPFIDGYDSDIMEEIKGIAGGSQRPVEEIVTLNVRTELLFLLSAGGGNPKGGCTALAAVPPARCVDNQ